MSFSLTAQALPVVAVLCGLAVVRLRRNQVTPVCADCIVAAWCLAALFAKQVTLLDQVGVPLHSPTLWGLALSSTLPTGLIFLIPGFRRRATLTWLTVFGVTLLMVGDRLYYAWFEDMLSAVSWPAIVQIGTLRGSLFELSRVADAWAFVDLALALVLLRNLRRPNPEQRTWAHVITTAAVLAVTVGVSGTTVAAAVSADRAIVTQRFSNLTLVERVGPLPFHALDLWLVSRRALAREFVTDQVFEETLSWLRERAPLRAGTGPWFGAGQGKNLIVIQVESLQQPVVDLRVNGLYVMPNLRRISQEGVSFTNVSDQTDQGRSSDADWLMLTSQLPESQGAAAFTHEANHLVGLPSLLASRGYDSFSAVPFTPSFWNRRVMHQNLGFFRSYFADGFSPGPVIGWGLNDRDFLQQMVPRLVAARKPVAAWLITLSLHYPFDDFPAAHKTMDLRPWDDTSFGNYLHAMHFFDDALGEFVDALRGAGLLDNSVLVVTGDHSAGLRWQPEVAHALGFPNDLAHWTAAERVPLAIRIPGSRPVRIDRPVGQLDFAPTILGILGIDAAPMPFVGRNQLGQPGDEPIIHRKGGWVDASHLFLLRGPSHGSHCYDVRTLTDVPVAECDAGNALATRKALMPRRIQEFDLQQRLFARLQAELAPSRVPPVAAAK